MATPLYARYIPPSKLPPTTKTEINQASQALDKKRKRVPPHDALPQDDTPPKKPKKRHNREANGSEARSGSPEATQTATSTGSQPRKSKKDVSVHTSSAETQNNGEEIHNGPERADKEDRTKKKKDKKRKSRHSGADEATVGDVAEIEGDLRPDVSGSALTEGSAHTTTAAAETNFGNPHRRKHKRQGKSEDEIETKLKAAEDITANDQDGDESKHKAVLSKYKKSTRISQKILQEGLSTQRNSETEKLESVELHGLEPLPEPEQTDDVFEKPTYSTLPSWLSQPLTVSSSTVSPFSSLSISPKLLSILSEKGYNEAFAVQSAVLPLLLPGPQHHKGDLCVSAATGSGKTLSYVLPMVEGLRGRLVTRLRGIIVVPTRELVNQVRETFELCSPGSGLKIDLAVGNRPFKAEQALLVRKGQKYAPEEYKELLKPIDLEDDNENANNDTTLFDEDLVNLLPNHVIEYTSNVDILICTPGRLVEHIRTTPGFTLDHVQWLVIDEADRLLNQSFQEWVDVVIPALENQKPYDEQKSIMEQVLADLESAGEWVPKKQVTKVILSATMTRDISKLAVLNLRRPKLIVVEGAKTLRTGDEVGTTHVTDGLMRTNGAFELPRTLQEYAVPVPEANEKPLYLLQLLRTRLLIGSANEDAHTQRNSEGASGSDSSSDTSLSSSEDESDSSLSDSDSSESSSGSSTDDSSSSSASEDSKVDISSHKPTETPTPYLPGTKQQASGVLIFTNNNENAVRLSRLLSLLNPAYEPLIGTLTKSLATSAGRKVLSSMRSGKIRILIASDRASRGLDLPNLEHIVNYDIPTSITSYVHRVGRTARAGKDGCAWSFVQHTEARWFWNEIARGSSIGRGGRKVQRVQLDLESVKEEERKKYEEALAILRDEVQGQK